MKIQGQTEIVRGRIGLQSIGFRNLSIGHYIVRMTGSIAANHGKVTSVPRGIYSQIHDVFDPKTDQKWILK